MPLLVSSDAQNSAYSSRSLKDFFETRMLAPWVVLLSAWMEPSAALQLAPPVTFQFSMPVSPSISVTQPAVGRCPQPKTVNATINNPAAPAMCRFMVISPLLMANVLSANRLACRPETLLDFDADVLDNFRARRNRFAHDVAQPLGRARGCVQSLGRERRLHLRQLNNFPELDVQPAHDGVGRARRRRYPVPRREIVTRVTGLGDGRNIRQRPGALRAQNRD